MGYAGEYLRPLVTELEKHRSEHELPEPAEIPAVFYALWEMKEQEFQYGGLELIYKTVTDRVLLSKALKHIRKKAK